MVDITEQLCVRDRNEWRGWLAENHSRAKEIWLVHYKKHVEKPCVSYDDAVEEALCFGWIDGIMKRLDDERYILRYSPRRKKSIWSVPNIKRAKRMITQGLMTEAGLAKIGEAKENGEWDKAIVREDPKNVPPDLKKALDANKTAKKNFESFAPSYKKQYIWWITEAKRADTRARRIKETISRAEKNQKPGMI